MEQDPTGYDRVSQEQVQQFLDGVRECLPALRPVPDMAVIDSYEVMEHNSAEYELHDKDVLIQEIRTAEGYQLITVRVIEDVDAATYMQTTYKYSVSDDVFVYNRGQKHNSRIPAQRRGSPNEESNALAAIPTVFANNYYNELMMLLRRCNPETQVK